ncbi:unnamed protein product [Cylicocyclus nassatus]|uniref:Uncharacterized protein n=1 Tax=Cylicocyclus nassatus TaxID=53992 RepID=A0AA36H3U2_CYLNA|nr:unnamed protein product [Cylicocyclus nassatus]
MSGERKLLTMLRNTEIAANMLLKITSSILLAMNVSCRFRIFLTGRDISEQLQKRSEALQYFALAQHDHFGMHDLYFL